jgi:hypothetical protein
MPALQLVPQLQKGMTLLPARIFWPNRTEPVMADRGKIWQAKEVAQAMIRAKDNLIDVNDVDGNQLV